jgi:hypothetical protein
MLDWGEASPQLEQLLPNKPALLAVQTPRATARLTLNVKGLNMGDSSP